MLTAIVTGISWFVRVLSYLVLLYFVLCLFLRQGNRLLEGLARLAEPMLQPIRRILGRLFPVMPIDLAPVVFIILAQIAHRLLSGMIRLR